MPHPHSPELPSQQSAGYTVLPRLAEALYTYGGLHSGRTPHNTVESYPARPFLGPLPCFVSWTRLFPGFVSRDVPVLAGFCIFRAIFRAIFGIYLLCPSDGGVFLDVECGLWPGLLDVL